VRVFGRDGRSKASRRGGVLVSLRACRFALVAWITVLALVAQLGLAAQRPAMANAGQADAVAALGALSALLGPNVALCLHEDGSAPGSPGHGQHDCCIECALCQAAGHAAALVPPDAFLPARFAFQATPLVVANETERAPPRVPPSAQPRAPPLSA
jgi:hypothetical protein